MELENIRRSLFAVAIIVLIGVGIILYRNMRPRSVGQWSWYIWCIFVAAVALFMIVTFMSMSVL